MNDLYFYNIQNFGAVPDDSHHDSFLLAWKRIDAAIAFWKYFLGDEG